MIFITCTRCYKSLDQSLFINNQKGNFYKRCITCREQDNKYTSKRKKTDENVLIPGENVLILSYYKELDQHLSEMINDIGQEENCGTGIEFSCVVDISFYQILHFHVILHFHQTFHFSKMLTSEKNCCLKNIMLYEYYYYVPHKLGYF